jgi:hypothetical protein
VCTAGHAHGTAGGQHRGAGAWEAWAFLAPSGGGDAGARITADPTTTPVAISLAPTAPALPTGSCGARRRGRRSLGALCRGPGVIAPRGGPGRRLPHVALVLQWRQDYSNNRPPRRAAVGSDSGHLQTHAVQRTLAPARAIVPLQPSL